MKDISVANFILGMEIKRDIACRKLWLNQRKYVETILHKFNMKECKPIKVHIPIGVNLSTKKCPKTLEVEEDVCLVHYASVVGSLMYAMVCTRPDIAHVLGFLSIYMSKPGKEHWTTVKRVFKYLHGTTNYAIYYQGGLDKTKY
jgi:ATP-binding cassette subfamily B (MDR/TAP) protein 1